MKKLINGPLDVMRESLEGFAAAHSDIVKASFDPVYVVRADAPVQGKVGLVSGGGSGHEPLHGGFVGLGMLDAACPGEVFTSPTPDQMHHATTSVDSGAGVLHIVKNYTGDVMNFEMAAEMAAEETGTKVESVLTNDDVARQAECYRQFQEVRPGDEDRVFYAKKWWQKLTIMFGGPAMNLLLAVLFFAILIMGIGQENRVARPVVSAVSECVVPAAQATAQCPAGATPTPAAKVGIKPNDRFVSFAGQKIENYPQLQTLIRDSAGKTVPVVSRYHQQRFKGVNDLIFAKNGDLYFTDQGSTGLHDPTGCVYRYTAAGKLDPGAYQDIVTRAGRTFDADDVPGGQDDARTGQPFFPVAPLPVSYLPDPLARGVALRGLPGLPADHSELIPFEHPSGWPDATPVRLVLELGGGTSTWTEEAGERVLHVTLPRAEEAVVRYSSYVDPGEVVSASWIWHLMATAPGVTVSQQQAWLKAANEGRLWMITPYQTLHLVHAVRRPLKPPIFVTAPSPLKGEPSRRIAHLPRPVLLLEEAVVDGVEARLQLLPLARCPALDEPEVEERYAILGEQQVVARVRISREEPEPIEASVEETE